MDIQNLLRIIFRVDFLSTIYFGEVTDYQGEDVEFSMQSSSTSRDDNAERISRPSNSRRGVIDAWRL